MFPIRDVNPTRIRPVVTLALIAANLLVYFIFQEPDTVAEQTEFVYRRAAIACELTTAQPLSAEEILSGTCGVDEAQPVFPEKSPFLAVLTSMFLHGGIGHVVFNMWFLWIFGNNVEDVFGHLKYLILYLVGGVAATATFVFMNPDSTIPLVGASGAVAVALGAYAILFPGHRVLSLVGWFVVPVPAAVFLVLWFAAQFVVGQVGVAWEAHVGGFVFGAAAALLMRGRLLRRLR